MSRIAFIAAALALSVGGGGYALAQSGTLTALAQLERGEWTLRASDGSTRAICVTDPRVLLQLRERSTGCTNFVVENGANAGRITFSCPTGKSDTRITVETPRLVRIETQGIIRGLPFTEEYEGRRTGACKATAR
ncbi:hypothetical protein [Sphingomonas sp.]|uniref:hypothetical protein n=1 Tax=Sphingomonas sp. TaxID=28214 RepID=UPI002EDB4593